MASYQDVLAQSVPDVQEFLDGATPAQREALLALEAQAESPRKGVLEYVPQEPLPEGATLVTGEVVEGAVWRALVDENGDLVRRNGHLVDMG